MRQAVAYYRVSTKRQEESGLGLEAQKKAVFYYAKATGLKIVQEFTETESGKNSKRPKLKLALRQCRKQNALLVIAKLDRLARNVAFISALMESKIDFVAVDNPSANDFIKHVTAAWAQYERVEISNRTKAALAAAKAKGVKLGANANRLAQINKERSEDFVRRMQPIIETLRDEGITSIRKIAEELKCRRIKTFRGRYKWQRTSVYNLLLKLNRLCEQGSKSK
jgi:DNA invertase Pin-like site-specific DNA recombinase